MKTLFFIFCLVFSSFLYAENQEDEITFEKYFSLAQSGEAKAQFSLGALYYLGKGTPKNYHEAFQWYEKAANQGYIKAESILGYMYQVGEGVEKNFERSIEWNRKAANQGDETAQYNLGEMYCYMNRDLPQRLEVCYALISLSAANDKSGVSEAALNVHMKKMTETEIKKGKKLAGEMTKPNNLLIALDEFMNTHSATKK